MRMAWLALAAASAPAFADSKPPCLPTVGDVTLSGRVHHERRYGPPNYGETPKEDVVERIVFLRLDKPIRVCADGEFREVDVDGVRVIQLAVPARVRDGRTTVSGEFYFSHTAHHYTDVLMLVHKLGDRTIR